MRKTIPYIVVSMLLLMTTNILAQNRQLDKANDLYKMERYAEAIPIYEKLLEEKENLALQTKLAYCYRINNKMEEAEDLYRKVVKEDRANAITYFYYAETLIANEKYQEAKYWFREYQKMERDDDRVELMLKACDEIQSIQPYFRRMKVTPFPYNSDADDSSPVFFNHGIVFSSDRKQGVKLLKQKSGWTGRDYLNLYYSEATSDTSLYDEPKSFSSKLNELNKNIGNPSFTADGSFVFFTRNNNELSKKNSFNLQLYQAESAGDGRWKNVEKLPFCSAEFNFMHPAVSPDGEYLFFVSDKARGLGGTDIYVSKKKENGWDKPENLGEVINTAYHEGFPFIHENGHLYFCSKGHVGYGGFDVFVTQQNAKGEWQKPINLGKPINSSLDDISVFLNEEETEGMFTSSRDGGDDDIYLFTVGEGTDYQALATNQSEVKTTLENTTPTRPLGQLPMAYEESESRQEMPKNDLEIERTQEAELEKEKPQTKESIAIETPAVTLTETPMVNSNNIEIIEENKTPKDIEITKEATIKPSVKEAGKVVQVKERQTIIYQEKKETPLPVQKAEEPQLSKETTSNTKVTPPPTEKTNLEVKQKESTPATPMVEPGVQLPVPKVTENLERLFYLLQANKATVDELYRLTNVYFEDGQFKITPAIGRRLDELAALLSTFPNLNIELIAHTSSVGSADKNLSLSQVRAAAAKVYLVRQGIEGARIVAKGFGETQLVNRCADGVNCTEAEHRENQRMLVKVIGL